MSLLSKLTAEPQVPDYAPILRQFNSINLGKELDVSPGYIQAILTGNRKPGGKLDKRLADLARQVEAEMAVNA